MAHSSTITIVNQVAGSSLSLNSADVTHGIWANKPSQKVAPGDSNRVVLNEAPGDRNGTAGVLKYTATGTGTQYTITFASPANGKNTVTVVPSADFGPQVLDYYGPLSANVVVLK